MMDTVLRETSTLIAWLGHRTRLQIGGVLFPGFIILCEVGYPFMHAEIPPEIGTLEYLSKIVEGVHGVVLFFVVLFVLAVAYGIGYVNREIIFSASDFWLARGWPPARTLAEILGQVQFVHGPERVEAVLSCYEVFKLESKGKDAAKLPRLSEFYVREFCKLWLRTKIPKLATDAIETEINVVIGLVLPMLLAPTPALFLLQIGQILALVLLSLLAAGILFMRINRARCQETEEALVNFLFAHWEGLTQDVQAVLRTSEA